VPGVQTKDYMAEDPWCVHINQTPNQTKQKRTL
jgi:hypothetical protein